MDFNRRTLIVILLALLRRLLRVLQGKSAHPAVKIPPFYDVSHWITPIDWANIRPVPLLMGTKATESDNYKDPTFPEYFNQMKNVLHCKRLAYHFFRRAVDPVRQANWFADYIAPYITSDDILALDFEEGGETASQLWAFLNRLRQRFPSNQIWIYSRKNLMDPIQMTEAEKTFFKSFPSWPAGYPTDPDPYTTTPAGYIPDQSKWGRVAAWQYTDDGEVAGFPGNNIDLNLIEQWMVDILGGSTTPPDTVTQPYRGVLRKVGRRYNSDVYITTLNAADVRFKVLHEHPFDNGLFLTSIDSDKNGAQFGWNGDEWEKNIPLPAFPKNLAVEDGRLYVSRRSAEPSFTVTHDGLVDISHTTNGSNLQQVSTGRRYLIENGTIKDYLSGSEPQYTERHPRGIIGISKDKRRVIMLTVDGRSDVSAGVTLKEAANIMAAEGAWWAFDRGGGGDAVDVMNGQVQNVPCDTGINGQPGVERAIPQAIIVYAQGEQPMPTYRYDATAKGDGTRLRTGNNTTYPYVNSYPTGTLFQGDELFIAPVRLSNANGVYQDVGDQWLRVVLVNGQPPRNSSGQPVTGPTWVAIIHLGSRICNLVDHGGPPPEPEPPLGAPTQALFDTSDGKTWKSTVFTEVVAGGTQVPSATSESVTEPVVQGANDPVPPADKEGGRG